MVKIIRLVVYLLKYVMPDSLILSIFKVITTIVGVVMSIGYFPQLYKIYKSKSAKNVSITSYTIFAIGTFIWTIYGFVMHDIVLILSFIVGVIGSRSVLFLAIRYRKD